MRILPRSLRAVVCLRFVPAPCSIPNSRPETGTGPDRKLTFESPPGSVPSPPTGLRSAGGIVAFVFLVFGAWLPTNVGSHAAAVSAPQVPKQLNLNLSTLAPLVPPVAGGIVDNWRPPSSPYGPGNQGVDLRAVKGDPVQAVGDGVVTFAGQVGGRIFVVIDVGGGIRITLGFLARILVHRGQMVRRGETVGYANGPVHLGARLGITYIDPRPLFAQRAVRLTR